MEDHARVPTDLSRVSLGEAWEVEYWTKALGATEKDLHDAMQSVGSQAEEVRRYLARRDPPPAV